MIAAVDVTVDGTRAQTHESICFLAHEVTGSKVQVSFFEDIAQDLFGSGFFRRVAFELRDRIVGLHPAKELTDFTGTNLHNADTAMYMHACMFVRG